MSLLMFGVKCQVTESNQGQVENMKTSIISLDLIIQMTLMNTPKKEWTHHCIYYGASQVNNEKRLSTYSQI